jgi:hypothetical protein
MDALIPALLGGVLAFVVGAAALVLTSDSDESTKVDVPELIGGVVLCLLICFGTFAIGNSTAKSSKLKGYHQFINGSVMVAKKEQVPCDRDGSCTRTYQCDPYTVMVTKTRTVYAGTDSNGNSQYRTETYTEPETRYHRCPYATEEYNYWLVADFGYKTERDDVYVGAFSDNPLEWRAGGGLPGEILRGDPSRWVEAKQAIDDGNPVAAVTTDTYTNYILATDDPLLKRYSPDVEKYRKKKLLPDHTANWDDEPVREWSATKFHAVGGAKVDIGRWNEAVQQFNAALGVSRQGDLHMVVVPASKIENPQSYINALMAHWQSDTYGKHSLAKNGIAIAVGLSNDGKTVEWVKEKTGMPVGNGQMQSRIESIKDVPFDVDTFLGQPRAKYVKGELSYTNSGGLVEDAVIFDKTSQFVRACMECKDKTDSGSSFVYLEAEVKIPTSVLIMEVLASFILCVAVWVFLFFCPVISLITGQSATRRWRY